MKNKTIVGCLSLILLILLACAVFLVFHLDAIGNILLTQGDSEKAKAICTFGIRLMPNNPAVYYCRAGAYQNEKDYSRSINDYSHAIKLDPGNWVFIYNRGRAYEEEGDFEDAILDYSTAIKINTTYTWAYILRGNSYFALNQTYPAMQDYSKAIDLNPNEPASYYNRGILWSYLSNTTNARQDFEKALVLYKSLGQVEKVNDTQQQLDKLNNVN